MAERREHISIDDFGNLLTGRSASSGIHHVTSTVHTVHKPVISTAVMKDELQDQISWYRREVERKEKLINDLQGAEIEEKRVFLHQQSLHDSLVQEYRMNAEEAREELASTIAKMQAIEVDMKELQQKLTLKSSDYAELKSENSVLKENNSRQATLIASMRSNVSGLEGKALSVEMEYKACISDIERLKKEKEVLETEIARYKSLIEESSSEKIKVIEDRQLSIARHRDLYIAILIALGESTAKWDAIIPDDHEALTGKVSSIIGELSGSKIQLSELNIEISKLKAALEQAETEVRAGRETIMRLVSEAEKSNGLSVEHQELIVKLQAEKGELEIKIEIMNQEISKLTEELAGSKELEGSLISEKEELLAKIAELESQIGSSESSAESTKLAYERLRENIAAILSHGYQFVDKNDECIVMKTREFMGSYRSQMAIVDSLDMKLKVTMEKLAGEELKVKKLQEEVLMSESKVHAHHVHSSMNGHASMATQGERMKFLAFIEKLSSLLKMDSITSEMGLDVNSEALLERVRQLIRKEENELAEKTSSNYQLQRKIKALKEELEGKELHLDMLRKKITQLEEKSAGKVALVQEKEAEESKVKKMKLLNEKLRSQLGDARVQISTLKSDLGDINGVKLKLVEKDEEIRVLVDKLDHLEKIRNKQAKQLAGLKQELNYVDYEAKASSQNKQENITHLSEQTQSLKKALDEVARRERQLVEFRSVVAKMLGMEVSSLTVPDYEIISKLEKMIQHHHMNAYQAQAPELSSDGQLDSFWEGYERAKDRHERKKKTTQSAW